MSDFKRKKLVDLIDKYKIYFALIILASIAAFFRLWQIIELPGGLFPDEAANGLDVNSILQGGRSPFFERGNGREGLFFYLLAISVEFFGRGPWQHHIVSAIIGTVEVVALFFLARRMFNFKTAFLASFFMATSTWHIVLSRTAFRAIMIPLFTTLTFYYIIKFIQDRTDRKKIYSSILAGAFFALGFYTYIAYRMMPAILIALAVVAIFVKYSSFKKTCETIISYKKYLAISAISFLLFFAPLGYYFLTHPGSFVGRSGQVSVFTKDLNHGDVIGTIINVADKTAWSFFTAGDLNWRHNVSGLPFLPPTLSLLFFAGIAYSIWRSLKYVFRRTDFRDGKYLMLVIWFFAMLIPELMTAEGIPHGLRLIGTIPVVFIFPAIILAKILNFLIYKFKKGSAIPSISLLAVIFYAAIIFIGSYKAYFIFYASSPDAYYAYRSDLTVVSDYINVRHSSYERNKGGKTYLSLDKFSEQTVLYLTTETNNPYILVVPEKSYDMKLEPNDQIIFTQSTLFDTKKFREHHRNARLVVEKKNKFNQTIMEVYEE